MRAASFVFVTLCLASSLASADAVTEWNKRACDIIGEAKLGTPPANRALAITHTAVYEAETAHRQYPTSGLQIEVAKDASSKRSRPQRVTLTKMIVAGVAATRPRTTRIDRHPGRPQGVRHRRGRATPQPARVRRRRWSRNTEVPPGHEGWCYVPTTIPPCRSGPRAGLDRKSPSSYGPARRMRSPINSGAPISRGQGDGCQTGSKARRRRRTCRILGGRCLHLSGVVRSVATKPGREIQRTRALPPCPAMADE